MEEMGIVVTIDGPAASGKSSVSRELARRMGWNWVSTGAFYRGLAYVAMQLKIDLNDTKSLIDLTHDSCWSVTMAHEKTHVVFKGHDVTDQISREDVGNYASHISKFPDVRKALLEAQRRCSEGETGLVAEGRDCGTVVFPTAEAKVFLTANSENRAARRAAEHGANADQIAEAQKVRDQQDSSRTTAPMKIPDAAFVLDTTSMTLEEVINHVEVFVKKSIG